MIHLVQPQIALSQNSKPASRWNRVVLRRLKALAVSHGSHILLFTGPEKTLNRSPPGSVPQLPTVCALFVVPDSPIKTHSTRTLQRFSPIHF